MSPRRLTTIALLATALTLGAAGPAQGGFFGARTVDGPSADVQSVGNVAVSRDGGGGVVYVKNVAGVPHVFAVAFRALAFAGPVQVDAGVSTPASDPVIAAADGGRLIVAFASGGRVFVSVRPARAAPFGPAQAISSPGSLPALAMSVFGTAYVSFTAPNGPGASVYAARVGRTGTVFSPFGVPLNANPARNAAATTATRSAVAVGSDGGALVTWGEDGADGHTHVIARRLSDTGISDAPQDLTLPSLEGRPGAGADSARPSLQDASDFGSVVFRQTFIDGPRSVSRTVARQQLGSEFMAPVSLDPLRFPTAEGADDPQVQVVGRGPSIAATELVTSHQLFASSGFGAPRRLGTGVNAEAPMPAVALGEVGRGGIAWQQSAAAGAPSVILARAYTGHAFSAQARLSNPAFGGADAAAGLSSAADRVGDLFVAFTQGPPASRRVILAGRAVPPGSFRLTGPAKTRRRRPRISWSASSDAGGLRGYRVYIDGRAVGTTRRTTLLARRPLSRGRHRIRVVAVDRFGQTTAAPTRVLVVR